MSDKRETLIEQIRTWLEVADDHREQFGDDDDQNHELCALRDLADAVRELIREDGDDG